MPLNDIGLRGGQPMYPGYTVTPLEFKPIDIWGTPAATHAGTIKGSKTAGDEGATGLKYQLASLNVFDAEMEGIKQEAKSKIATGMKTYGDNYFTTEAFKTEVKPLVDQYNQAKILYDTNKKLVATNAANAKSYETQEGGNEQWAIREVNGIGRIATQDMTTGELKLLNSEEYVNNLISKEPQYKPLKVDEFNTLYKDQLGFDKSGLAVTADFLETAKDLTAFTTKLNNRIDKAAAAYQEGSYESDLFGGKVTQYLKATKTTTKENITALDKITGAEIYAGLNSTEKHAVQDMYYNYLHSDKPVLKDKTTGKTYVPTIEEYVANRVTKQADEVKTVSTKTDKSFYSNKDYDGGAGGSDKWSMRWYVDAKTGPTGILKDAWTKSFIGGVDPTSIANSLSTSKRWTTAEKSKIVSQYKAMYDAVAKQFAANDAYKNLTAEQKNIVINKNVMQSLPDNHPYKAVVTGSIAKALGATDEEASVVDHWESRNFGKGDHLMKLKGKVNAILNPTFLKNIGYDMSVLVVPPNQFLKSGQKFTPIINDEIYGYDGKSKGTVFSDISSSSRKQPFVNTVDKIIKLSNGKFITTGTAIIQQDDELLKKFTMDVEDPTTNVTRTISLNDDELGDMVTEYQLTEDDIKAMGDKNTGWGATDKVYIVPFNMDLTNSSRDSDWMYNEKATTNPLGQIQYIENKLGLLNDVGNMIMTDESSYSEEGKEVIKKGT